MKWITEFLRNGTAASSLFSGQDGLHTLYFERPRIDERFKKALKVGPHIVLYGPPLQGKTTLVKQHLDENSTCFVDCREDTKRKDIYRNVLTANGFQVVQEVRRKGKLGAKASVKFFETGIEAGSEGEIETKAINLTADLSNANDVVRLVGRAGRITYLVLNNFQRLREATKENLLLDLAVFDEGSSLKIIIVGAWIDPFYLERYLPAISHRFEKISCGFWSGDEVESYLKLLNGRLPVKLTDEVMTQASEMTRGNIVSINQLVSLYSQYCADIAENGTSVSSFRKIAEEFLVTRFHEIYIRKLRELAGHRDLLVEYILSPKVPRRGMSSRPSKPTSVVDESEEEKINTHVGHWFLKHIIPQVRASKTEFPISQLCQCFVAELDSKPKHISARRLRRCFAEIVSSQADIMIYPEIFTLAGNETISVTDNEFIRFCGKANLDKLFGDFDEAGEEVCTRRARPRNRLWRTD